MTSIIEGASPPHFIVFIPGFMGSRLRKRSTGELVWLDIPALVSNPLDAVENLQTLFKEIQYPNDDLVADGIIDQILFLPPLFKLAQYSRLLEKLHSWGYSIGDTADIPGLPTVFPFTYDWRQDNRLSARQLALAITGWKSRHPDAQVWIIAHSNGGLVARWYIEKEGGREIVSRLFLLASPWDGAPKSIQVLQEGLDIFLLRLFNQYGVQQMVRSAALTMPCFYQLIPSYLPFLRDLSGEPVLPLKDLRWLDNDGQKQLAKDAAEFNAELGSGLSVETECFFGTSQPTTSRGTVRLSPAGKFEQIEWDMSEDGDGTLPVHSALHFRAQEHLPYPTPHGEIYAYKPLLDKLHFELVDRFRYGPLAAISTSGLKVQFKADHDAYSPGEPIVFWASIHQTGTDLPIYKARVDVRLVLKEPLPLLKSQRSDPGRFSSTLELRLSEIPRQPGFFAGSLGAPDIPGYYEARARIHTQLEPAVNITELILIEPPSSL